MVPTINSKVRIIMLEIGVHDNVVACILKYTGKIIINKKRKYKNLKFKSNRFSKYCDHLYDHLEDHFYDYEYET